MRSRCLIAVFVLVLTLPALAQAGSSPKNGHHVFMQEAVENDALTQATLPAYQGKVGNQTVWYVVTDASTTSAAAHYGANFAPKLQTAASVAMPVTVSNGQIVFSATPDFSPSWFISQGAYGECVAVPFVPFGPSCFGAGAVAGSGYTPLIRLPDGTVLDAPQVANDSGMGDKVVELRPGNGPVGKVVYQETTGLYEGHTIHYMSFDASIAPAAALEKATLAPALATVPNNPATENEAGTGTARAGIVAFTNGPVGLANPDRQGLNAEILDSPLPLLATPLNVIQAVPLGNEVPSYSPIWDVHLATWASGATPTRQTDFEDIRALAGAGIVTQPDGSPFAPSGFDVNCPIVSSDPEGTFVIPQPS
jgi:hypothetical protein